jgi:hypothetical protein
MAEKQLANFRGIFIIASKRGAAHGGLHPATVILKMLSNSALRTKFTDERSD